MATVGWAVAMQSLTCMLGEQITGTRRGQCCVKVANYLQAEQAVASRSVECAGCC